MLLLAAESCLLYESLQQLQLPGIAGAIVQQFFHHPWHGLRFWDLVQPAFMTMAGAALYIAYYYKLQKGISWQQNFKHIAIRCLKLFLFGTALHCIYAGRLVWELWNVLTQLAFTTLLAYWIIRRAAAFQIIFSIVLLLLTEAAYRLVLIPGFNQPFVTGHNFGNWMDTVLMGKTNSDGWVAINCIPTAAHTIWGVLAGKLLISAGSTSKKIKVLLAAGTVALCAGYLLNELGITPIIKRISTSSFVLVSGGWVLLILTFLYWLIDIKKWNRYAWIFTVVGMNAIFIYLFFETVGVQWLNATVAVFVKGAANMVNLTMPSGNILSALTTLTIEWALCYFLYKKKLFFKL